MTQSHFPRKSQTTIEYLALIMLIMLGIIVMGPYAIRAINAHFKAWEDSVQESFDETINQTVPDITLPDCSCRENQPVCGGGTCQAHESFHSKTCTPVGCEQTLIAHDQDPGPLEWCDVDADCCTIPILDCAPGNCCGPAAVNCGVCQADQICKKFCCGDQCVNGIWQYVCATDNSCIGQCVLDLINHDPVTDPLGNTFNGGKWCRNDNTGLVIDVAVTPVPYGECTDQRKCEIECPPGSEATATTCVTPGCTDLKITPPEKCDVAMPPTISNPPIPNPKLPYPRTVWASEFQAHLCEDNCRSIGYRYYMERHGTLRDQDLAIHPNNPPPNPDTQDYFTAFNSAPLLISGSGLAKETDRQKYLDVSCNGNKIIRLVGKGNRDFIDDYDKSPDFQFGCELGVGPPDPDINKIFNNTCRYFKGFTEPTGDLIDQGAEGSDRCRIGCPQYSDNGTDEWKNKSFYGFVCADPLPLNCWAKAAPNPGDPLFCKPAADIYQLFNYDEAGDRTSLKHGKVTWCCKGSETNPLYLYTKCSSHPRPINQPFHDCASNPVNKNKWFEFCSNGNCRNQANHSKVTFCCNKAAITGTLPACHAVTKARLAANPECDYQRGEKLLTRYCEGDCSSDVHRKIAICCTF